MGIARDVKILIAKTVIQILRSVEHVIVNMGQVLLDIVYFVLIRIVITAIGMLSAVLFALMDMVLCRENVICVLMSNAPTVTETKIIVKNAGMGMERDLANVIDVMINSALIVINTPTIVTSALTVMD